MAVAITATGTAASVASQTTSPMTYSGVTIVNLPDITGITIVGLTLGNRTGLSTTVTSVTFGGATVTQLLQKAAGNSTFGGIYLGYVLNSTIGSTGNKTISVVFTPAGGTYDSVCDVICFSGQDSVTPLGTAVSAAGTSASPSVGVTDSVAGDIVVDVVGNGSPVTSSNQTNKWLVNLNNNSIGNGAGSVANGATGTITMSYVVTSDVWAIGAVAVKAPTGGGGAVFVPSFHYADSPMGI